MENIEFSHFYYPHFMFYHHNHYHHSVITSIPDEKIKPKQNSKGYCDVKLKKKMKTKGSCIF